jgi:GNAT superfamily N-acetyltransferase
VTSEPIRIVPVGPGRDAYLPLLYLTDGSVAQVHSCYQTGRFYALDDRDGSLLAIVLAVSEPDGCSVELKTVAVDTRLHGNGIGTRLVAAALDDLRQGGMARVIVGTSSSNIGPLAFYQKSGFRFWKMERDFFTPARGYPEGELETASRCATWSGWTRASLDPVIRSDSSCSCVCTTRKVPSQPVSNQLVEQRSPLPGRLVCSRSSPAT